MKKKICSFVLIMAVMAIILPSGWKGRVVQAASHSEIQSKLINRLYNGAGGRVSCDFDGYTRTDWRHEGIDFCLSAGSNVYAVAGGTVTSARQASGGLTTIAIYNESYGVTIIYLHTKNFSVNTGDVVAQGQIIAQEGANGADSAHTHVELRPGRQTSASISKDATLANPDPYPYWESIVGGSTSTTNPTNPTNPTVQTHDPLGCLDSVEVSGNMITIKGWAFDYDNTAANIDVHAYIDDGLGGQIGIGSTTANKGRPDIINTYPGVGECHGFEAAFGSPSTGTFNVYVYAMNNVGEGSNQLIGQRQVTVSKLNGKLEGVSVNNNNLAIAGWAFDQTDISQCTKIYVFADNTGNMQYIGGGNADLLRQDVDDKYHVGNNHGFYVEISTLPIGTYNIEVYVMGLDEKESMLIGKHQITVQSYTSINVNKTDYRRGDNVTFIFDSNISPTLYTIGIDKDGTRVITQNVTSPFTISTLDEGSYTAYVTAFNPTTGGCDSNTVSFTVSDMVFAPKKSVVYNGHTYTLYDGNLTWQEAKVACSNLGGNLVTITSEQEQNVINNLLVEAEALYYWIGLSDTQTEGNYQWVTGEAYSYTNWCEGQPDNWNDEEDYIIILRDGGGWNDTCDHPFGFILEKESTYTITYDSNGGSNAPSSQSKTHGTDLTLSSSQPTRSGYTFIGWSTDKNAADAEYNAGEIFSKNEDTTLYAVWEKLIPSSISVKSVPDKQTYYMGGNLDTTGLVLTAVYSDGSEEDITEGFTVTPVDLTTVGTQEITVSYEGKTTTFSVTVNDVYSLSASPESAQTMEKPVVLTATGGSSYRFYYEQNGKWVNIRNYAADSTCVWTPTVPKEYTIYVDIKDNSGKLIATKRIQYTVTDAYTFTLDKENEQNVGVNITLTATGGASYKFYYEYNGAWCNITTNTTGICKWSPKYAGNYMLYVDIKDETGKVIACRTQAFKLNDPFLMSSDAQSTELPYGNTINFIAAGGTSYKFYYEKQGEWQRVQDFSAVSTCAWTPTAAGTYNFYCDIKDASGAVVSCKRMTFNITNPYSFTADKATTQSVGTKITFTATGGYQYKFYYEKDGAWARIQSFSTADTCSWTPTVAGRYNVYCDIADENGTVLAYKGMEFVIGDVAADSYSFTTSVESPNPMNEEVTLTATGGSSYKFYYEVGGKWATVQNFSTTNTATWTPDMIADYTLYVDIKNSSDKVVKTLSKKFSATDPYSFTADVTSPQNIGKSVKFTAAGGASYKFYYQFAGAWVKIQDSTSATCNWKPNKAGEYMVYVDIKNASGAVVTCRTMKLVFNDPYRFTTSASSLTQPAGTAISLSADGGASYKFYYEKDGAWVRIQNFSTTNTCTWTPTEAGKYNVFCDIKDTNGSVAVCKRITFTITEKCTITAGKTNASVGDTITFTATGGSSYKFYYEKDGAWVRIQSFSTSNTCTWKPAVTGDYVVYVDVNDASGNLIGCKGTRCVVG